MSQNSASQGGAAEWVGQGFTRALNPASIGLALAAAAYVIVQGGTFIVLMRLTEYYHTDISKASWSLIVATIGCATLSGVSAGVGVRFGVRRMMLIGCVCQIIGAVIDLFAGSLAVHLVGRGISVLGGANFVLAFSMAHINWSGAAAKRAEGIVAAGAGLGGITCFMSQGLIGKYATSPGGWRNIFWVLIGVALIAFALIYFFTHESPKEKIKIDYAGAVGLGAWLVLILLPLTQATNWGWGSARVIGLLLAGGAVLAAWVPYELWMGSHAVPFLDIRILARPGVWQCAVAFGAASWMAATPGLLISYLGAPHFLVTYGLGASMLMTASIFACSGGTAMVVAPVSGFLIGRGMRHKWVMIVATTGAAAMYAILASYHSALWIWFVAIAFIGGLDYGWTSTGAIGHTLNHVKPHEAGVASGMLGISGSVFSSIATALASYIVTTKTVPGVPQLPTDDRFTIIMVICAGVAFAATLLVMTIKRSAHVHVDAHERVATEAAPGMH